MATASSRARPVLACSPLYPPVELIHAAGFHPRVLWDIADLTADTPASDKHLQPFCCSVARRLTEHLLQAPETEFAGYLFYNACDTLRNLPEIVTSGLQEQKRTLPQLCFHLPAARLSGANARAYLADEVAGLRDALCNLSGATLSLESFRESVALYAALRNALLALEAEVLRGALTFAHYATLTREAWRSPVETALPVVEDALAKSLQRPDGAMGSAVLISGILPPPLEVDAILAHVNVFIRANDIATLHRTIAFTPEAFASIEDYYQQFYENHFPCPTLLHTADRRVEALVNLARACKARGVIFVGEKFCEYEYFEYPVLEKRLDELGIASLCLEFAIDGTGMEAQKTRIEAFAEVLAQRQEVL